MQSSINDKKQLWDDFCNRFDVHQKGVPLFEASDNMVSTFPFGSNGRQVLKRSSQMDALISSEVNKVIADYVSNRDEYEGLIYMMYWQDGSNILPLYIGKSEKLGKSGNLSENIRNIERNHGKFCRWGYNYAYHIGDLSAVVCPDHEDNKRTSKYAKWADRLFLGFPDITPKIRKDVFFWMTAWRRGSIGPWKEYGATSLTFLEYLLIGIASDVFKDILLNEEGVNRT